MMRLLLPPLAMALTVSIAGQGPPPRDTRPAQAILADREGFTKLMRVAQAAAAAGES